MEAGDQLHPGQSELNIATTSPGLLGIDGSMFQNNFDAAPFIITHALSDHPLFEMERLMQLAQCLPPDCVEYNAGTLPISCDPSETPRNGLSMTETIRRIEECQSWMVLKYVDRDAEYGDLLHRCLDEIKAFSEALHPGMSRPEAFIFLSSPRSITPYHMDPEHNFLLQIRGNKHLTVFDRSLVSPQQLEKFYRGAHRNMEFNDDYMAHSVTFELRPGEGLHVPVAAPHFVRNGEGVSISFSITFRTPDLEGRALLHNANALLRTIGLAPGDAGRRPALDNLKVLSARVVRRVRAKVAKRT